MPSLNEIRDRFRRFGAEQASGPYGSPLYVDLCAGLADDPGTAGLLLEAAPTQQIPNLLLAAVHDLLLSGGETARHPLARYYPTVVRHGVPPDDETYPAFRAFCMAHRRALVERLRSRSTQTNEPRRAALLFPALGVVAREAQMPLALLEAGASAGLLLLPDRYAYGYGDRHAGDPSSPLMLPCRLLPPLEPQVPDHVAVAWRAGLDLAPIDVHDPVAVRWLAACLWPEHHERADDLRRAIELARRAPPRVVRGDFVDGLDPLIAEVPTDAALVVLDATALLYLSVARRRRFVEAVDEASRTQRRTIWLLSLETIRVIGAIDAVLLRRLPDELPPSPFAGLALSTFAPDGTHAHRLLALAHPHGRWLRWLDAESALPAG